MKKKTVYVLRLRNSETQEWCEPIYYTKKKNRDKDGAMNRIIGGIRTHSYEEKVTEEQLEEIDFEC